MINNKKPKIILCSVASLGIAFSATKFYNVYSWGISSKNSSSLDVNNQDKKITELKKEGNRRQKNLEGLRKELMEVLKNINEETQNKDDIDNKIKDLQEKIDKSNNYINQLSSQILEIENHITEIEKEIERKADLLRDALVMMYKTGDASTIDIVLGAKDFGDFIEKADIVKSVSNTVGEMIDNLKNESVELEKEKAKVDNIKSQQEEENNTLEKNRGELQILLSQSEKLLSQYKDSEEKTKQQISENEAAIKAADDEIRRYLENQRKKDQEKLAKVNPKNPKLGFVISEASKNKNQGGFIWPVPGFKIISSNFSDTQNRKQKHGAIDIAGSGGNPIYGANVVASGSGTVIKIGYSNGKKVGYGNTIVIDHGNGILTRYSHLSSIAVKLGQNVAREQVIGQVGNTGYSTGPHLDFTFIVDGEKVDPLLYVRRP